MCYNERKVLLCKLVMYKIFQKKNVFDWEPFDYLHWLRTIQDAEEQMGNIKEAKYVKMVVDGLQKRISIDTKENT